MTKSVSRFVLLLAFCVHGGVTPLWSETGKLLVLVQDLQKRPVKGVEIGIEGGGGSGTTGNDGKVLLPLSKDTHENDWISLQILHSPPGKDLVILPSGERTLVPSFKNKAENFVRVVVIERGNLAVLQNPNALRAFAEQINKANAPKSADKQAAPENPKANLEAVAKQYGLSPDDLDKAIKSWGAKSTDPYDAGLAALYARNYDKATTDLQSSLGQREEKLASDQKAVAADRKQVAEAAFFLGYSLYEQGRYNESAVAYQHCLQIREDDPLTLNNAALSLMLAGDYARAEVLYRRALAINEKSLGPEHPYVAPILSNLAQLLQQKGDYTGAEPLMRRALAIQIKALGPDHPSVALDLNNLALLLYARGHYAEAQPLLQSALAIDERALGANHPNVARDLINLAMLLREKGEYAEAESLARRALAIDEKALGPDHPDVARNLNNLATLLEAKGDYTGAESLYRRALAIDEKALGPDHPEVATNLNNLAALLEARGDLTGAEPLYRRALAIDEKALGPNHPGVSIDLNNLALLLKAKGDYEKAEPLMRQALMIDEKALGPDHPQTRRHKKNLDTLLQESAQLAVPKAKN